MDLKFYTGDYPKDPNKPPGAYSFFGLGGRGLIGGGGLLEGGLIISRRRRGNFRAKGTVYNNF